MNYSFSRYGRVTSQLTEIHVRFALLLSSLSEDLGFWVTILNKRYCVCALYEMRLCDSVMSD